MSNPEGISLLCPLYNDAEHIEETLQSIIPQLGQFDELLILDNCSSDRSFSIAKRFESRKVKALRNHSNIGSHQNWRSLITLARSRYIHFIGSHDRLAPGYLDAMHAEARKNGYPPYIVPKYYSLENPSIALPRVNEDHPGHHRPSPVDRYLSSVITWPVWWVYSLVRKDLALKCFIDDVGSSVNSDHYIVSRLLFESPPLFSLDSIFYARGEHHSAAVYDASRHGTAYRISSHKTDRLYWAITYMHHFALVVSEELRLEPSAIRRIIPSLVIQLLRVYPGYLANPRNASILYDYIDCMNIGPVKHCY